MEAQMAQSRACGTPLHMLWASSIVIRYSTAWAGSACLLSGHNSFRPSAAFLLALLPGCGFLLCSGSVGLALQEALLTGRCCLQPMILNNHIAAVAVVPLPTQQLSHSLVCESDEVHRSCGLICNASNDCGCTHELRHCF